MFEVKYLKKNYRGEIYNCHECGMWFWNLGCEWQLYDIFCMLYGSRMTKMTFWYSYSFKNVIFNNFFSYLKFQEPTEDLEDKNLSWLFNFKLDELPHLSPEVNRSRSNTGKKVDQIIQEATAGIEGDDLNIAENLIVENIVKL